MFIELHQTKDGLPIFVNSSHIQCIAKWSEKCSFIYFDSDHWIEATEPYDEIRRRLTNGIAFVAKSVPDEDCKGMRC